MYPFDSTTGSMGMGMGMGTIALIGLVVLGVILLIVLLFSLVSYILGSLGMYAIAKRRGIRHSWLSWIPYGNVWILGSISDQYQYVVKGKIKNRRKILLAIMIATVVPTVPIAIFEMLAAGGLSIAAVFIVAADILLVILSIVGAVFQHIAYYDLFRSCKPESATAFLVLEIIFPVTLPFFVFACRNQDKGMPPRKRVTVEPVQIPDEPKEIPAEVVYEAETIPGEEAETVNEEPVVPCEEPENANEAEVVSREERENANEAETALDEEE